MKKRIVAIGLIAILIVSTLAGCSCSNSTTNNTTNTAYKCDFKNSDIAIPEGTKLTDNGLEVTDKAETMDLKSQTKRMQQLRMYLTSRNSFQQ